MDIGRAQPFVVGLSPPVMLWQMRCLPEREHRVMPWANGRGSTMEIATYPSSVSWAWRISLADVTEDGAFSALPGLDRSLVVASGKGMRLTVGEAPPVIIRMHEHVEFSGDVSVYAHLIDGPVRDLNLMVRRAACLGTPLLDVRGVAKGAEIALDGAVAIVVLDGALTMTVRSEGFPYSPLRRRVGRFDAVLPDDGVDGRLVAAVDSVLAFAFLRSECC